MGASSPPASPEFAITVIGADRPGIIADVSAVLAGLGLNLTDSTMTLLRGHFAMTLICTGGVAAAGIEAALAPLAAGPLVVTVREVATEGVAAPSGGQYVLRLHGADRLGIVAAVTRVLADVGGNITDLTTRLAAGLYVIVAEVDLPATVDIGEVGGRLRAVARDLGVEATLEPVETDLL
jgi:glycine cleavage system transcriptional repressor